MCQDVTFEICFKTERAVGPRRQPPQISIWTFCLRVFDHSAFAFLQASPGQKHGRVHSPQHLREESRRSQLIYGENQSETLQCTKYK